MRKKKLNKAQIGTALKPITAENVSDFFSLFSIPQKAITKLITGKYQAPSEAMGIKNKAGAIATDMILDPVNLVGAGAVKATGAYKNAYKLNPFAEKLVNSNKSYRVAGRDAFDDFVESGVVRSYTPMPKPGMSLAERLGQRPTAFPSFQKGYADLGYLPKKGGVVFETGLPTYKRGQQNPVTGEIIKGRHYAHRVIDPKTGATLSRVPGDDIKVYEGVPHWLMGHKEIKVPKKKKDGGWLDKYDAPKAQNGIEATMDGLTDQGFNYNGAWGGTMQMGGNLPGSVGFMYARTGAPSKGPRRNQTDVTDASAQNGAEMRFYQEGLDWKPKNISQDGIKVDPMGYWNPDNVGEPVIIPSNEITMEGVYEPLIGISDTGDVQYMEPGEEYEFDGESVTEYPIMQKGGRAPMYTDNPKDPRLRAYNDSLSLYKQSLNNMRTEGSDPDYKKLGFVSFKNSPETLNSPDAFEKNDRSYPFQGSNISNNKNIIFNEKIKPTGFDITYIPRINSKQYSSVYKKPVQPVVYKKPEPKKEQPVKKEEPKPVERKQNIYEGSPVYSPGVGSGLPSALIGFANQKGDTTYIKPEDYERFAVPKYAKELIEKKKNGGWLDKYN
jgi:hypothetical protein